MANSRFGVLAEVLPPLDKRVRMFTRDVLSKALKHSPLDTDTIELGKAYGLLNAITCTEDNRAKWEHLPVAPGDQIYQFVEGLE